MLPTTLSWSTSSGATRTCTLTLTARSWCWLTTERRPAGGGAWRRRLAARLARQRYVLLRGVRSAGAQLVL